MATQTTLRKANIPFLQKAFDALSKWAVNASGYQKYGLYRDDLFMEEDPAVAEALRRLPQTELDKRVYRLRVATDLSMKHAVLPRDQWTNPDNEPRYLTPIIAQVRKEFEEKKEFENK